MKHNILECNPNRIIENHGVEYLQCGYGSMVIYKWIPVKH